MTTVHCSEPFCDQTQTMWNLIFKKGFYLDREWYCSASCFNMALQSLIRKNLVARSDSGLRDRRMRLGPYLIHKGLINREQLDLALERQHQTGTNLGECILELGLCTRAQLTSILSEQQGVPWVGDSDFEISREVLGRLPKSLCKKYRAFPFEFKSESNELLLAVKSPIDDAFMHIIRKMLNCRIRPFLIQDERFQSNLDRYNAGSPDDREETVSATTDTESVRVLIKDKMNRYRFRQLSVLFHDDFFWVRFRKGPRNLLDLIIQIPELSNIAGSDRKSLPDQDENEVNIAS